MENRINLKDGLIKQNMIFMSGMLIAPVIACATSLMKSLAVCFVFSFVSLASILVCRLIPRTIVYTIRVTLYTIAAAVFYIPAALLAGLIFGETVIKAAGVYLPILITNSLILSKTETRFYLEPKGNMAKDVIGFILGFDIACTITGALREFLASGRIAGAEIPILFTIPALETTFGGFLFVGIGAGLFRAVYNYRKAHAADEEDEDSLAEYAEDVGEFLVGRHTHGDREKIRIYKAAVKRAQNENDLLEMEFLSNRDVLAAFEAIVSEGQELTSDSFIDEDDDDEAAGETFIPESEAERAVSETQNADNSGQSADETEGGTENADIS